MGDGMTVDLGDHCGEVYSKGSQGRNAILPILAAKTAAWGFAGPGQVGRVGLQGTGSPVEFDGMSQDPVPLPSCGRQRTSSLAAERLGDNLSRRWWLAGAVVKPSPGPVDWPSPQAPPCLRTEYFGAIAIARLARLGTVRAKSRSECVGQASAGHARWRVRGQTFTRGSNERGGAKEGETGEKDVFAVNKKQGPEEKETYEHQCSLILYSTKYQQVQKGQARSARMIIIINSWSGGAHRLDLEMQPSPDSWSDWPAGGGGKSAAGAGKEARNSSYAVLGTGLGYHSAGALWLTSARNSPWIFVAGTGGGLGR
ncbi:hypothetical protein V8F20_000860 [Naviculisporaceae sp. PSN 640]